MKRVEQFIKLFVAGVISILLLTLLIEIPKDEIITTPFDVPSEIKEFTGKTVAELLTDRINMTLSGLSPSYTVIRSARTGPEAPRESKRAIIASQEGLTIKTEVGGISLDYLKSYIKNVLKFVDPIGIVGKREIISGNIIQNGNNIQIIARTNEDGPWIEQGEKVDLDTIIANLAEQMAFDVASNPKEYSQLANFYRNNKKYEKADLIYRKITEENTSTLDAEDYINWGKVLMQMWEDEEGICKYKEALKLACPGDERKIYLADDQYKPCPDSDTSSTSTFLRAGKITCTDVLVEWGIGLSIMNQSEEAIKKYDKAKQIDPKNPRIYSEWGYELYLQEKYKDSISKFNEFVNSGGTPDRYFYSNWGFVLESLGEHKEAIEKFKKATEIDSEFYVDYYNWGLGLYNLALKDKPDSTEYKQHLKASVSRYNQALHLNPTYDAAYYNWGLNLYNLALVSPVGSKERAQYLESSNEKYKKATELKPDYDAAYYNWGLNLYNLALDSPVGSKERTIYIEASISKYKEAIRINPTPYLYNSLGLSFLELKNYGEAIAQFKKAIEIDPEYAFAYYNWGDALHAQNEKGKAAEKFKKFLELSEVLKTKGPQKK